MDKQARLALLKFRASSLKGAVSNSIDLFRPAPSARHSLGLGGGVIFRSVSSEKEEGLPADFVATPVLETDPIISPEMDREVAATARSWADFELTVLSESSKLLLTA